MKGKSDILVAASVISCSVVMLGALYFAILGNPFLEPYLEFTVDFEDVSGIAPHSEVRYAGSPVGVVRGIEHLPAAERLDPGKVVRVHVAVLDEVDLPRNLRVTIDSVSLLGEKFIRLERVNDEDGNLESGTRLSADRPRSLLDDFLPGASDIFAKIDGLVADLASLAERLNRGTEAERLATSIENLEEFTGNLNMLTHELDVALTGEGDTPGLTTRLDLLVGNLETVSVEVRELVEGTESEVGLTDGARRLLENLDVFSGELNAAIAGTAESPGLNDQLTGILDELNALVAGPADRPEEAIRAQLLDLTDRMDKVTDELQIMAVWAQYFTGSLAARPNRLIFGRGGKDIPNKEEILRHIRQNDAPYPVGVAEDEPGKERGGFLFRQRDKD